MCYSFAADIVNVNFNAREYLVDFVYSQNGDGVYCGLLTCKVNLHLDVRDLDVPDQKDSNPKAQGPFF
jgi:hypothetical protein